jgi:hypothetical protein
MMCNGVCVGVGAPTAENPDPYKCPDVEKHVDETGRYEAHMRQLKAEEDAKILAQQNTGISPMLILAAAAAAFFIGG